MNSFGHGGRTPRPKPLPEARGEKRPPGALSPSARKPAIMQDPVLVLNATFEPINVTAVRRAMVLMIKGVAQAEEIHHTQVHSASRALPVPSVIRLLAYRHIPQQTRALSRKNILLRDRNTCQFCSRTLPASELTLDHVVPRARGGRTEDSKRSVGFPGGADRALSRCAARANAGGLHLSAGNHSAPTVAGKKQDLEGQGPG